MAYTKIKYTTITNNITRHRKDNVLTVEDKSGNTTQAGSIEISTKVEGKMVSFSVICLKRRFQFADKLSRREQFRCKYWGLGHDDPRDFYRPQCRYSIIYIIHRVIWALFFTVSVIASGLLNFHFASSEANRIKWFTFLTNWAYLLLTIDTIIQAIFVIHFNSSKLQNISRGNSLPWYLKLHWILYNCANAGAFTVTTLYWFLVYNPAEPLYPTTIIVHTCNVIYVLLNSLFTRWPVRLYHFYQTILLGFIYITFTAVYFYAGGTGYKDEPYLYEILDWREPAVAARNGALAVLVGSPLSHFVLFVLYLVRTTIHKCCCSQGKVNSYMHFLSDGNWV